VTSPALAPFWKKIGSQEGLLGTALQVTAGLGAAGTAAMLLKPFRVETVAPEHAGGLAAAAGQYGEEWTRGVIEGWFGSTHHFEAPVRVHVRGRVGPLPARGMRATMRWRNAGVSQSN
jgi:hypothetical protein